MKPCHWIWQSGCRRADPDGDRTGLCTDQADDPREAKDRSMLIDASYGRKTKRCFADGYDHVILSAIAPESIAARTQDRSMQDYLDEEELE